MFKEGIFASGKKKNILCNCTEAQNVLGLTATPEYSGHGLLPFVEGFLGKTLYSNTMKNFDVVVKTFNVSVDISKYEGNAEYLIPILNKADMISTIDTISRIISDPQRIDLIIEKIMDLYSNGNNILVKTTKQIKYIEHC